MQHSLIQGSPEWVEFRQRHHGASEAAAMLGLTKKTSRTELLHMKATGTAKEFSDYVQTKILDFGHEAEAKARLLVEEDIGTELYPVTCSEGNLSASCDGLTMMEDIAFEHKRRNKALVAALEAGELPEEYMPQCQQIMMVTGAQKVIFTVSDGTRESMLKLEVLPDQEWFDRIRAGWEQFDKDLAVYSPVELVDAPVAKLTADLPAVSIQMRGEIVSSNFNLFAAQADTFLAEVKTELVTDQDFADAERNIKICEKAEAALKHAKEMALSQTESVSSLLNTLDTYGDHLRTTRLSLSKAVESQKKFRKDNILLIARQAFSAHVEATNNEIAPFAVSTVQPNFDGEAKGKKSIDSIRDAVDTELANSKIKADATAKDLRAKLAFYQTEAAGHEFLFADLKGLGDKSIEHFQMIVTSRIDAHKKAEAEKAEALRAKIAQEERIKAEAAVVVSVQPDLVEQPAVLEKPAQAVMTSVLSAGSGGGSGGGGYSRSVAATSTATTVPTLNLGKINERIAPISISVDGLTQLGFAPAKIEKAARLYHEGDFLLICAAIVRHIQAAAATPAQAA